MKIQQRNVNNKLKSATLNGYNFIRVKKIDDKMKEYI